jgi:hypothetical protein
MTYYRVCNKNNPTGAINGTEAAYLMDFGKVGVVHSLVFCAMICRSLFVLFFFSLVIA